MEIFNNLFNPHFIHLFILIFIYWWLSMKIKWQQISYFGTLYIIITIHFRSIFKFFFFIDSKIPPPPDDYEWRQWMKVKIVLKLVKIDFAIWCQFLEIRKFHLKCKQNKKKDTRRLMCICRKVLLCMCTYCKGLWETSIYEKISFCC